MVNTAWVFFNKKKNYFFLNFLIKLDTFYEIFDV